MNHFFLGSGRTVTYCWKTITTGWLVTKPQIQPGQAQSSKTSQSEIRKGLCQLTASACMSLCCHNRDPHCHTPHKSDWAPWTESIETPSAVVHSLQISFKSSDCVQTAPGPKLSPRGVPASSLSSHEAGTADVGLGPWRAGRVPRRRGPLRGWGRDDGGRGKRQVTTSWNRDEDDVCQLSLGK